MKIVPVEQLLSAGFHFQRLAIVGASPAGSSAHGKYSRDFAPMYRQFHQFFAQAKRTGLYLYKWTGGLVLFLINYVKLSLSSNPAIKFSA
jgi:hypothetical protein